MGDNSRSLAERDAIGKAVDAISGGVGGYAIQKGLATGKSGYTGFGATVGKAGLGASGIIGTVNTLDAFERGGIVAGAKQGAISVGSIAGGWSFTEIGVAVGGLAFNAPGAFFGGIIGAIAGSYLGGAAVSSVVGDVYGRPGPSFNPFGRPADGYDPVNLPGPPHTNFDDNGFWSPPGSKPSIGFIGSFDGFAYSPGTRAHQEGLNDDVSFNGGRSSPGAVSVSHDNGSSGFSYSAGTRAAEEGLSGGGGAGPKPIIIDLDGDGVELITQDESFVLFDWDDDGFAERSAWVGADDGFLMFDENNDGQITTAREIAFAQWTAADDTDLEALAAVFDSNNDGKLNQLDTDFANFKIWQDVNGNGKIDAGEVQSLAYWGITEISLT